MDALQYAFARRMLIDLFMFDAQKSELGRSQITLQVSSFFDTRK